MLTSTKGTRIQENDSLAKAFLIVALNSYVAAMKQRKAAMHHG